jgi:hypothetical protein
MNPFELTEPLVLVLIGNSGVGKDTFADHVISFCESMNIKATKTAFAKNLKDSAFKLMQLSFPQISLKREWLDDPIEKEREYPSVLVFDLVKKQLVPFRIRLFLQQYGTECLRNVFGETIHSHYTWENITSKLSKEYQVILITDCRFMDEWRYSFAHSMDSDNRIDTHFIYIKRPSMKVDTQKANHASEQVESWVQKIYGESYLPIHSIVNEGTVKDYHKAIEELFLKMKK